MKLLILSRYDRQGASSRLRQLQYISHLKAAGFEVEVQPLFDRAYLDDLYADRRNRAAILLAYGQRIRRLRVSGIFDVVWVEKEALPWLPARIERLISSKGAAIITDYDDAIFHRYDKHRVGAVRRLLGRKIASVMRGSDIVLAGNAYLADYADQAGATRIEIVPTVVDADVYTVLPPRLKRSGVTLGWIGTPGTWRECAAPFLGPLKDLVDGENVRFVAVGAGEGARKSNFDVRSWSEGTEISDIQNMDIGVMPLPDTPWMQGKCGYKLIQYMACGLPVVASPVGVNSVIVEHGVNGFLARTEREWTIALQALIDDPELRRRMGAEGRKKVESWYSLQVQGPRVAQFFREAAERHSG